jgi:hypothetical protein
MYRRTPSSNGVVADDLPHGLRDVRDRDVLGAHEVVRAVRGHRAERAHDAVRQILDVHEAARLQAVARNRQRLAGQRSRDERGDHRGGSGAWAVGDAEAQDGVLEPVQLVVGVAVVLARELGRRVEVRRRVQRKRLDVARGRRVRVHPDRRRVYDAPDPGVQRGLQDVQRAPHVAALRPHRVGRDLADVRGRGEVDDGVAAGHRAPQRALIAEIAEHDVDFLRRMVWRRTLVADARPVAGDDQLVDHVRPDEPRAASDQDA